MEGFAQRAADGDGEKHSAEKRKNYHRIERPDEIVAKIKGDVYKKLDEDHHCGGGKGSTAEDVEISATKSYAENGDGAGDSTDHHYRRKGEGKKPVAVKRVIDIAKIKSDASEIDGSKYDGMRTLEPGGQDDYHVGEKHSKHTVSRPGYGLVETYVANGSENKGDRKKHGYNKKYTRAVEFLLGNVVFRIGRLCFFAYDIGVIDDGAAERTAFFGVGELNAAFYTVHIIPFFLSFLFGCFRP